jgi:putative glutamine amidotransferase
MQKPVIGITPRIITKEQFPMIGSPRSYIRALSAVGALPVVLPVAVDSDTMETLLDRVDGVVFSGGGDIETERFNGLPHEKIYDINPERDQMEVDVVEMVLRRKMPFLGICRGIQLLNVALGGTLYTHILDQLPGALDHSFKDGRAPEDLVHTIRLEPASHLAQIIGKPEIEVNSLHHQGVWQVGEGLAVTGCAPDGLVEAVELPGYPFGIAVQWHPEWLPEQTHATRLFAAFIAAAQAYGER